MSRPTRGNEEILSRPDEFREVLARARTVFESMDGVVSVGVGQKETAGEYRDDIAIVVTVRVKRPMDEVAPHDRVPPEFEGYPTDVVVIEMGEVIACENTEEYPTIRGGIQISTRQETANIAKGTLGCIVRKRGDTGRENVYLLTCRHVLYSGSSGEGQYAYHPFAPVPTGVPSPGPSRVLGPIQKAPDYGNVGYKAAGDVIRQFYLDCAIARIDIDSKCGDSTCTKDVIRHALEIVDLGLGPENTISDVRNVIDDPTIIGQKVYKVGRTTGRTVGIVRQVSAGVAVRKDPDDPSSGIVAAQGLISIDIDPATDEGRNCKHNASFGEKGDSGSIVVDEERRAIGMLAIRGEPTGIAPITAVCFALHIMPVLDNLGVCIASPGTSRGACGALDGTGTAPARPTQAELPAPDGRFHFTASPAARSASPVPIHITDAERDRMLLLRDALRETAYGIELHETFADIRREVGYLVRNVRAVKVAWHRHRGPAYFAHVLNHLRGEMPTIPHEIDGISRTALLTRMGEVLRAHGSMPLRVAIEQHGPILLPIFTDADTVHDCLAGLHALEPRAPEEVTM